MIDPERTVLWSAASPAPNNTSITLNDSIDNYDEIVYYGSGMRNTYAVAVKTEYPVISGKKNGGGPFYYGCWTSGSNFVLCNGTQLFLSGTTGQVYSSYYWGKNSTNTAFTGALANNRVMDVRPYKIEGLKYSTADDRTLLWSANGNPYNTNITLSESVTAFREIIVYGSGTNNSAYGYHLSKQVYPTQNSTFGCEPWAYSPWEEHYRCNYLVGCDLRISGNSGHVGSAWYMGLNRETIAFANGKWTGSSVPQLIAPYAVYGINRK